MTNPTPRNLADRAAEAVRGLNHATQSAKGELTYPGDAYKVVASLKTLTQRLPQSFEQLAAFLRRLDKTDMVTADYGTPEEHLAETLSALASSALIAQTLTEHLDRAHNALAPLGWNGPLPDTSDDA